ncbi:MAG: phenylalanine--tRNA ligase subunit beta [Erysipelotrichaceae bacterium]
MKTSRKWMEQYLNLEGLSNEAIAKALTDAGLEVESVEPLAQGTHLTIGQVLSCEDHPDSDHLHVCMVDLGDQTTQIVCGAPNVALNQKVIVAKVGAKLPEINIKAAQVRGVESNGMICSLSELGVNEKQLSEEQKNGIEVLGEDAKVGQDPLAYLGLDDVVFDIGLTPNRNDCMAAFAFMKECGAIFNQKVSLPHSTVNTNVATSQVHTQTRTLKSNFILGTLVGNVQVGPSVDWMKKILMAAGVKAINNVVDISNLVMLETGQPLHFYDADVLSKKELIVRDDFEGDFVALDGNRYEMQHGDLMIFSDEKPVGIAGIMGGEESKVSSLTTTLLIESAHFHNVSIRNTSRRLNLQSDASVRFQKGIDPQAASQAMERAVSLLQEYANATVVEPMVGDLAETPLRRVELRLEKTNALLGTAFTMSDVEEVLQRLDFDYHKYSDSFEVIIPSYRLDLHIEEDLIEEVIRLKGFDALPSTLPVLPSTVGKLSPSQSMRRKIKQILTGYGINEAITYTLTSQANSEQAVMPLESRVVLASAMSEDRKIIRGSILPSLLESVAYNQSRSLKDVALFEISNVYAQHYFEERLAVVLQGVLSENRWQKVAIKADFYVMKGIVEQVLANLGFEGTRVSIKENTVDTTMFHPYRSACIYLGKELLGIFGEIHPLMAKTKGVSSVVMLELITSVLYATKTSKIKYTPMSRFQAIKRDLALVVDLEVSAQAIIDAVRRSDKNYIQNIEIFDVYVGEHVEAGKKSIALSITLQAKDKTLVDAEIQEVIAKVMQNLEKQVGAVLRSA